MYPKPPKQEEQRPLYETSQVRSLIKAHATSFSFSFSCQYQAIDADGGVSILL